MYIVFDFGLFFSFILIEIQVTILNLQGSVYADESVIATISKNLPSINISLTPRANLARTDAMKENRDNPYNNWTIIYRFGSK
jgi:hypothetical protein